jgi:hypothetical protein
MKSTKAVKRKARNKEASTKRMALDADARFLLQIIGAACGDPLAEHQNLKDWSHHIKATLLVFKCLGLAEEAQTAFGWKPTDLLFRIVAMKATRLLAPRKQWATARDQSAVAAVFDVAWPNMNDKDRQLVEPFSACVLASLSLLRSTFGLGWEPTNLLTTLFTKADYDRLPIAFD